MALLLAEGFDSYGYNTDGLGTQNWLIDSRWLRTSTASMVNASDGRASSGCAALTSFNAASLTTYSILVSFGGSYSTVVTSFGYKVQTTGTCPTTSFPILLFQKGSDSSTDQQFVITRTSADALEIRDHSGGSVLASSSDGVVSVGTYQYWEIKAYCHDTNGYVVIKIDGTEVINATGINTQYSGTGAFNYLHFRNYNNDSNRDTFIDDFILMDNSGTSFNDFQGDLAIVGHLPDTDGTDSDWTSTQANHYDSIDVIGSGWDTDYIESSTEGHQDSYTITPGGTYPSILALEVAAHGINPGGGTAKIKPYAKIDSVDYYGDELTMPAGSDSKVSYIWETNPATGTLWSKTVVQNSEFGFEVTEIS